MTRERDREHYWNRLQHDILNRLNLSQSISDIARELKVARTKLNTNILKYFEKKTVYSIKKDYSMRTEHYLKIEKNYLNNLISGVKKSEIRCNDRD